MRFLFSLAMTAALLWMAAFAVYLVKMQQPPAPMTRSADALVVLTGGNGRVERGFALLASGAAPVLFISGVGEKVTANEMLAQHASPSVKSQILARGGRIVFDYQSSTTQTNAVQSASFIRAHHYRSIRLITAHYHMPRSLLEFHAALPETEILAEPVVPEEFAQREWWNHAETRSLLLQEFHKYLAANLRLRAE